MTHGITSACHSWCWEARLTRLQNYTLLVLVELSLSNLHEKLDNNSQAYEQRHFYASKAKTETRHPCLKQLKNEIHACKTREVFLSPRHGQHPERDLNEIGMSYRFA